MFLKSKIEGPKSLPVDVPVICGRMSMQNMYAYIYICGTDLSVSFGAPDF